MAPAVIGASRSARSWALIAPCTGSTAPATSANATHVGSALGGRFRLRPGDQRHPDQHRGGAGQRGRVDRVLEPRRATPSRRGRAT